MAAILQSVIVPVFTKESATQYSEVSFSRVGVRKICSANGFFYSTSLTFWSLLVTWCTNSTTVRSAHAVFMCIVFIWEQTGNCATYSINWLVFITEMKSVYCAVRTGSLN